MSFKYINPGYGELLQANFGATVASNIFNPLNKTCFTQTASGYSFNFASGTKEIWLKFGIYEYTANAVPRIYFNSSALTPSVNITGFRPRYSDCWIFNNSPDASTIGYPSGIRLTNSYHDFLVHVKSASDTAGIFDIWLDGILFMSIRSSPVAGGSDLTGLLLQGDSTTYSTYFSNLIISDEEIGVNEKVAILPMKNTILSGWTDNGDGTYTVAATGATIKQTPDLDTLKASLDIAGISVKKVQVNALNTSYASPVNAISSIFNNGGSDVAVETKALGSSGAAYTGALALNPITGAAWTNADFAAMQVGIESAAV